MAFAEIHFIRGTDVHVYAGGPAAVTFTGAVIDLDVAYPGLGQEFPAGVDAALNLGNGYVYFFCDAQYARYNVGLGRVDWGAVPIAGNWGDLGTGTYFPGGVDAAVAFSPDVAYFFKGSQYLRFDVPNNHVSTLASYPLPFQGANWGNPPLPSVGAAFNPGDGRAILFSGTQYARFDVATHTYVPGTLQNSGFMWDPSFTDVSHWTMVEVTHAPPGVTLPAPVQTSTTVGAAPATGYLANCCEYANTIDIPTGPHPTAPAAVQYRQYVRASSSISVQTPTGTVSAPIPQTVLPYGSSSAVTLQPNTFTEDGGPASGPPFSYGHRDRPDTTSDRYTNPDRPTGSTYAMVDRPGLKPHFGHTADDLGTTYSVDMHFDGHLIDTTQGDQVLATAQWSWVQSVTYQ